MTMVQGSPEWFAARLGHVGASRIADLTAKTKSGWGASRANLMAQLIAERLTGVSQETYTNVAMQWGTDTEPLARIAYEFRTDVEVEQVGFINHPIIPMTGASPDGLVGADGLVEIKCPNTATHIDTLLGQKIAEKYVPQVMWQMACTGRQWCDVVSFDPRMPETMRMFVLRIPRDETMVTSLEREVIAFLAELDQKIEQLTALFDAPSAGKARREKLASKMVTEIA